MSLLDEAPARTRRDGAHDDATLPIDLSGTTQASGHALADRPWSLETYGIEPVAPAHLHGRGADLFWIWSAANIGIVAVVYGAVAATYGLDLAQMLAVAAIGTVGSFALVGLLGLAGQAGRRPMLALSGRVFGSLGNRAPALVSWVSLVGWETITAVVATEAVLAIVPAGRQGFPRVMVAVVTLAAVVGLSLMASRLGHATIAAVQKMTAWTFGAATAVLVAYLAMRGHWGAAAGTHAAPFTAVLAAGSLVAASGGLSWVNVSADYSRYLPDRVSRRSIVGWTTLGASLPFAILVVVGFVLSGSYSSIASAANPVDALRVALPGWAGPPYLAVAIAGLLAQMVMGLYSSGLNLLALGIRVRRSRTVLIDAAVVIAAGTWITTARGAFLPTLTSFVELLACPVVAWAAVYLADMALGGGRRAGARGRCCDTSGQRGQRERRVDGAALGSWLVGTAAGLACTSSTFFTGPLAKGVLAQSSIGYFVGGAVAFAGYVVVQCAVRARRRWTGAPYRG